MSGPATTGVTAATWENMIVDAAVVYVNYGEGNEAILGATSGGATFGWAEFTMRNPEIDGLKGHIAGATRITRAIPQITANLIEWNLDAFKLAFPGYTETVAGDVITMTRSKRVLGIADHPVNVAMVGLQSGTGKPVVMMVKRPLVMNGIQFPTTENSEATSEVVFVGHYDPETPEVEPWEVRFPVAATTPPT